MPKTDTTARHDFFLAYASPDRETALRLYNVLSPRRVFIDTVSLVPGDRWNVAIAEAQARSLITVVLITPRTPTAYFQHEEILQAIHLSRTGEHRVIPVYLGLAETPESVPYGLRQLQAMFVPRRRGLKHVALGLKSALRRLKKATTGAPVGEKVSLDAKKRRVLQLERDISNLVRDHSARTPIAVYFADIDGFSSINAKYGPEKGNRILTWVENAVKHRFDNFYSARLTGDEFVVCVSNATAASAVANGELLVRAISDHDWSLVVPDLYVTMSVGIALQWVKEPIQRTLLRAVHSSAAAKREGGNRIHFSSPKRDRAILRETDVVTQIVRRLSP